MSNSICVPGPVSVPFTQPDPPRAEPIERAVRILLAGFETYRSSIDCTNDRIDTILSGGASVQMRRNSGSSLGPRPRINLIEGTNVQIALTEDAVQDEFDVTISVPGPFGDVTAGANVGGAAGLVFRDKTGTTLNFRSINPLSPLVGLTLGDQVLIAAVVTPLGSAQLVGDGRIVNGTSPIRIDGGASANLDADITVSYNFAPESMTELFDDFVGGRFDDIALGGTIRVTGSHSWYIVLNDNGSGATMTNGNVPGELEHPGIQFIQVAASAETPAAAPDAAIYQDLDSIRIQPGWIGEWIVRFPFFETNTANFMIGIRVGFGDDNAGADFNDGVYFEANRNISTDWLIKTANGGSRTQQGSGITIASNTWYRLRAVVDSGGTTVEFFINGVSVGTINSNLPSGPGSECGYILQVHTDLGAGGAAGDDMRIHYDSAYYRNSPSPGLTR